MSPLDNIRKSPKTTRTFVCMSETIQTLSTYCREKGRVCPQPTVWNDFWNLLPERRQTGGGWAPSLPLVLAAWHHTSDTEKADRLNMHIEWAAEHGALAEASSFLRSLPEKDWHHAPN